MNRSTVLALLPDVMRRADGEGTPLAALIDVLVECLHPVDATLRAVHETLDARRARAPFVGMLAEWVDLGALLVDVEAPGLGRTKTLAAGHGRLRELTLAAASLAETRGTRAGLRRFLELATGVTGFEVEEPEGRPFWIHVRAPTDAAPHRALIERILTAEKPAYVQCALEFDPASHATSP
jgi:phage tail-like protein